MMVITTGVLVSSEMLFYTTELKPLMQLEWVNMQKWHAVEKDLSEWEWMHLVHQGVRDKRRVSEIDLSQPRHETDFWWRHNGVVTSQSTDPNKWPNYQLELIGIYVDINTYNKESLTQRCRRSTSVQLWLIFLYISI